MELTAIGPISPNTQALRHIQIAARITPSLSMPPRARVVRQGRAPVEPNLQEESVAMRVAPAVVLAVIVPVSAGASDHASATLGPDATNAQREAVDHAASQSQLQWWEAYIQEKFPIDVQRMFAQTSTFLDIIHEAFFVPPQTDTRAVRIYRCGMCPWTIEAEPGSDNRKYHGLAHARSEHATMIPGLFMAIVRER